MFTKKLSTQFTASLLNAVSGVLNEATALGDTLKRERSTKEKKEPNGVKESSHNDVPFEGPYDKPGIRKDKYGNIIKNVAKHLAKKAMSDKANEETEHNNCGNQECCGQCDTAGQIDERVHASDYDATSEKSQFGGHRPHVINTHTGRTMYLGQHSYKKPEHARKHAEAYLDAYAGQGSRAADDASMDFARKNKSHMHESAEQIDELSKQTLGSYVKKATNQAFNKGFAGGANLSRGQEHEKEGEAQVNKAVKRVIGVNKAVNKMTKEEQDFVDSLNIDTLDEARGRPKKAGGKDFTINPRTKEKLMHDNPEHMKKIEALQRNGVIPEPKIEANQHVMQQLQRAKLSMRGGETVHFTHGDSHHVPGEHAAKLLTKYAGMKPDEKEAFQKKIGHSHANLKSEL